MSAADDTSSFDDEVDEIDEGVDRTVVTRLTSTVSSLLTGTTRHAYVIVLAGPSVGDVYRLGGKATMIGRAPDCEIRLGDDGISRRHAMLSRVGEDGVILKDLNSTNGTFINDKKVDLVVLQDGDRFQLGHTTILKFSISDEFEESFQRRLFEAAVRDGLTGLHNRKHLDERLEAEFSFAKRHTTSLSIIMLDLDYFKDVNDAHGHQAGDEVLCKVAGVLQRVTRMEDVVARYGGEEFAVLARGITETQATMLAERIRTLVEELIVEWKDGHIQITLSGGVATFNPMSYESSDSLMSEADQALYRAKELGRNRIVIVSRVPEDL